MSQAPDTAGEKTLLGHPSGLFVLFFAELWERFCYYGMRALLVFYVVQQFAVAKPEASKIYGAFTALIYALGVFGGYVADRVLGYRRSIVLGGVIMAIGEFLLVVPPNGHDQTLFLIGLSTLIVGNGLFKPNISSLVGKLYKQGDPRRDRAFTIFYMGINIGALLAPLGCQVASDMFGEGGVPNYRAGFALAGGCMLLGIVCFRGGYAALQDKGTPPPGTEGIRNVVLVVVGCIATVPVLYFLFMHKEVVGYALPALLIAIFAYLVVIAIKSDQVVRQRIYALIILLICNILFWASFEQAGNSLNFFADKQLRPLHTSSWIMPATWWQSVNAIFIVALAPVFTWIWKTLNDRNAEPSIPFKFGLGIIQVGLGFGLLMLGIQGADADGRVSWSFLAGLYLIHTMGELCISPVGLSMVTKLAPAHMTGLVMGGWFLSIANANYGAGLLSAIAGGSEVGEEAVGRAALTNYMSAFTPILYSTIVIGVLLCLSSRLLNKLMHGVK